MKGQTIYINQPRMTNTNTEPSKITELNSKRQYSLSTQNKKMVFQKENKIRLPSLTLIATFSDRKKISHVFKTQGKETL